MSKNTNLNTAKKEKNDEFYTMYEDIEKELQHYTNHFKGKVVYCNCDNPEWSNFWKYFYDNFDKLELKKLVSTHYEKDKQSYKLEYDGLNTLKTELQGNGDFRSDECVELLKECDIVCTNPPFSLFREYISQLMEYKKKFIVIGNVNAITYREIFPLIKDNKLWLGYSIHSGDREFRVPDDYPLNAAGYRVDEKGNRYIRVKGVRWFTNLDYKQRYTILELSERYQNNEHLYPKYDNYNAININKTVEIPKDYEGIMGVPITFLDKYNPEQFEIIGHTYSGDKSSLVEALRTSFKYRNRGLINGKVLYDRILIKRI